MAKQCVINVDLADVFSEPNRKGFLHTLAWGDYVDVVETTSSHVRIRTVRYDEQPDGSILPVKVDAYICPTKSSGVRAEDVVIPKKDSKVLKVNFVDVQQGDGTVIESPSGKVVLVDGGDNQLFARYLAARYRGTTAEKPRNIDCIVVTHGDADHFAGLAEIWKSESNKEVRKRLFIAPKRVYHNGLVKRPSTDQTRRRIAERDLLGPSTEVDGERILTGLVENILEVPDTDMNQPFREWKLALTNWNSRSRIKFRRLTAGMTKAFDFFNDDEIEMSVLGPMETVKGSVRGLKFLGNPPAGPRMGHESLDLSTTSFTGLSASHTINGHSIILKLRYGGFSFLLAGDLNDEAGRALASKHQTGEVSLRSEVFKVPHHGSADFSGSFLQMVSPVVSVVSSGDESIMKEYIHPRATLIGALGRYSRVPEPLIFVTELVAFFKLEGWATLTNPAKKNRGEFFAFSRTAYGAVKTRTDGNRLLVYTDSGKANMKEAYCYALDANAQPVPAKVTRV